LIQKANDIKPNDGFITDSLGWVYYKIGNLKLAILYLEKAAKITQFDTIIVDHLGDVYRKAGQPQKALDSYKKAITNAESEDEIKLIPAIKKKIKVIQKQLNE